MRELIFGSVAIVLASGAAIASNAAPHIVLGISPKQITAAQVPNGETITYVIKHAKTCLFGTTNDPNSSPVSVRPDGTASSTLTVFPNVTTTFEMSCVGFGGQTKMKSVTLTVSG